MQDPVTASFQSFDALFRRLFVLDAASNPRPWLALAGLQMIGVEITKVVIFATAIATLLGLLIDHFCRARASTAAAADIAVS